MWCLGCPSCVKAGLPVLLTRLGLADKGYAEARKGVLAPIVKKLAAPDLVASGYVLRTLRAGYVYAYYEKAHTRSLSNSTDGRCSASITAAI